MLPRVFTIRNKEVYYNKNNSQVFCACVFEGLGSLAKQLGFLFECIDSLQGGRLKALIRIWEEKLYLM